MRNGEVEVVEWRSAGQENLSDYAVYAEALEVRLTLLAPNLHGQKSYHHRSRKEYEDPLSRPS